jgi:hypothetical protein
MTQDEQMILTHDGTYSEDVGMCGNFFAILYAFFLALNFFRYGLAETQSKHMQKKSLLTLRHRDV